MDGRISSFVTTFTLFCGSQVIVDPTNDWRLPQKISRYSSENWDTQDCEDAHAVPILWTQFLCACAPNFLADGP